MSEERDNITIEDPKEIPGNAREDNPEPGIETPVFEGPPEPEAPAVPEETKGGQKDPEPDKQPDDVHTMEPASQEEAQNPEENTGQEQEKAKEDEQQHSQEKKAEEEVPHKEGEEKTKDKKDKRKGLLSRLRNFAKRLYQRTKHMVERAFGRGRIPGQPAAGRMNLSRSAMDASGQKDAPFVDKSSQEKNNSREKRNWGELFFHGIARRLLGRDAYMHAIQQAEKQETLKQEKNAEEPAKPAPEKPAKPAEKGQADRAEHPGNQEKPGRTEKEDTLAQGKQGGKEKEDTQKEPEEMKGKFKSLHKIITDDLENKYVNAKEAKETYLDHYAKQLQEKLTDINHGEPVQVSAVRVDGKLEIRINDEQDPYGGYPSFMGCSMIRIKIDEHLNIDSAEAFVATRQTADGIIGRKIDVSETLGNYIVSDLAKNFREDYNRGAESYNLASWNVFEKTMRDAAEQGRENFTIDNVTYSISVKDNQIQASPAAGGKAFTIAMDADAPIKAARELYEEKVQELNGAEKKLEDAKNSYNELAAKRTELLENCRIANAKAMEAGQKEKDIRQELRKIEKQLSGKYQGFEKTQELNKRKEELDKAQKAAFRESRDASSNKNTAQAALDSLDHKMKQTQERIKSLNQEAEPFREACREAKEQYDSISVGQKKAAMEMYQTHIKNVTESRESSIRVFEEILPEQKNDIGGNFTLEDLNRAMEETGRTSMEEALNDLGRDTGDEPSIESEHSHEIEEDRENGVEIE